MTDPEPQPDTRHWGYRALSAVESGCQTALDLACLAAVLACVGIAQHVYVEARWLLGTFFAAAAFGCLRLWGWAPWYGSDLGKPKLRRDRA